MTVFGIDVSHHNGAVDWDRALLPQANGTIKFVYVKASELYTGAGGVVRQHDSQFDANWMKLGRLNMRRGAYHYCHPEFTAAQMAELFFSVYTPAAGDLPPVLDVEDEYVRALASGHAADELAAQIADFATLIKARVRAAPFIYIRADITDALGNPASFADFPVWLAAYGVPMPRVPRPWTRWNMWQYSSSGTWPGIPSSNVDFNHFSGTLADLDALRLPAPALVA